MLSYQQFVSKHARNYASISVTEKRKRYRDYQRVTGNGAAGGERSAATTTSRNRPAPKGRRGNRNRAIGKGQDALQKYIRLFAAPFTTDTVGLPVFPSPPSAKITSWSRGIVTTGTLGYGFVFGIPHAASDSPNWYITNAAYAGNSFNTGTGVTPVTCSNLPFATASFAEAGVRQRLVCAAIRVRFIGTESNLGGLVYPFIHPSHQNILGFTPTTISSSEEGWVSLPANRKWVSVVWAPVHRTELEYTHASTTPLHNDVDTGAPAYMGILFKSTVPSIDFEYEIVQHHEFISTTGAAMTRTDNGVSQSAEPILSKLTSAAASVRDGFTSVETTVQYLMRLMATAGAVGIATTTLGGMAVGAFPRRMELAPGNY